MTGFGALNAGRSLNLTAAVQMKIGLYFALFAPGVLRLIHNRSHMMKNLEQIEQTYLKLGEVITALKAEQSKSKEIDWTKMTGTLVSVSRDRICWYRRYFHSVVKDGGYGRYACYMNGTNIHTNQPGDPPRMWKHIRLITNHPMPWFGGECPVCPNVLIRYWLRSGSMGELKANRLNWSHVGSIIDIIAYQILGEQE